MAEGAQPVGANYTDICGFDVEPRLFASVGSVTGLGEGSLISSMM